MHPSLPGSRPTLRAAFSAAAPSLVRLSSEALTVWTRLVPHPALLLGVGCGLKVSQGLMVVPWCRPAARPWTLLGRGTCWEVSQLLELLPSEKCFQEQTAIQGWGELLPESLGLRPHL